MDEQEIWNAFLAEQSAKNDAITEEAYHEFMSALIADDTQALQAIADEAWEFAPTAPRFSTEKDAPRFPTLLQIWQEAHPNVFKDEDDDAEWVTHTTPTEKDEFIPYSFPMPYPEDLDDEDLDDDDLDGVLDGVWRYAPTLENPDAWIAIAPSKRALRAAIRDGRWVNNPKVVRVSYRR